MADKRNQQCAAFDDAIRRALATPPISNDDILKRSKDRRERAEARPRSQQ